MLVYHPKYSQFHKELYSNMVKFRKRSDVFSYFVEIFTKKGTAYIENVNDVRILDATKNISQTELPEEFVYSEISRKMDIEERIMSSNLVIVFMELTESNLSNPVGVQFVNTSSGLCEIDRYSNFDISDFVFYYLENNKDIKCLYIFQKQQSLVWWMSNNNGRQQIQNFDKQSYLDIAENLLNE